MALRWVVLDPDLNKRATSQICSHHVLRHNAKSEPCAQEVMRSRTASTWSVRRSNRVPLISYQTGGETVTWSAGDAVLYSVTDEPLLASETMPPFSGSFSGMRKSIA